jgi:hypothetical protein
MHTLRRLHTTTLDMMRLHSYRRRSLNNNSMLTMVANSMFNLFSLASQINITTRNSLHKMV